MHVVALQSFLTTKEIITRIEMDLDASEIQEYANGSSLVKKINKLRKEKCVFVIKEDEEIPLEYNKKIDNFEFIHHYMHKGQPNRMIIFVNESNLCHLRFVETWYMDGTFKSCPFDFYRIYIIHASIYGKVYPLLYALLDRKTKKQYIELLEYVKRLVNPSKLKRIITYFEKSVLEACYSVFLEISTQGCYFHWTQMVLKILNTIDVTDCLNPLIFYETFSKCSITFHFCRKNDYWKILLYLNQLYNIIFQKTRS
ncbi:hypothetical protein DMUE_5198 [Dictyocoela muelleri]|nr:hypothetical protein DMUE_5198 [Dictyocoela muelleri]